MLARLRRYFISGLIVFLPLALTIYVFIGALNFFDGLLGKYLQPYFYENFGFYFRGVGILVGIYLIILCGFFVTNFFGQRIFTYFESLLLKLPFFKQIYPAIKEIATFLFSRDQFRSFREVVLVEYPRKSVYSFGFLTNDTSENINKLTKQELCNVFVPSAPGPLTGFAIMLPKKDIIFTDITVEAAIRFIVSGGVVNPKNY